MKNGTEQCDASDKGGATCASLGYHAGTLRCSASCTYNEAGCTHCGDGVRNAAEFCDRSDFGGDTCRSLGFAGGGNLACTSNCMRDFRGCVATNVASIADELDPSTVLWDEPAGNVGAWPRTARITSSSIGASTITIVRDPNDNWPMVQEEGWSKPSIGNWWMIAFVGGAWHGATIEWLGVSNTATGEAKTTMANPGFDGGDDIHGVMGTWRPTSGETVYMLQTTHARSGVIRGNTQRTQIVRATYP